MGSDLAEPGYPASHGSVLPEFRIRQQSPFELLRKLGRTDVIVAVSERLNLEKVGVKTTDFGERMLFFKGMLSPKTVFELAERLNQIRETV